MAQNSKSNGNVFYLAHILNLALSYWGGEQVFYVDGVKGNQKVVVLQIGSTTLKHVSEGVMSTTIELSSFGDEEEEIKERIRIGDTSYRAPTELRRMYKGPDVGIYSDQDLRNLVERLGGKEIILGSVYHARGTAIRRLLTGSGLLKSLDVSIYGGPEGAAKMEEIIKKEGIKWRRDRLAQENGEKISKSA